MNVDVRTGIDKIAEVQLKPYKEGDTEITMKCQADGNAEPAVEWYRNKVRYVRYKLIQLYKNVSIIFSS